MNEVATIECARRGGEAAWAQIIQRHQESVFRLAYLILGNREDAEDVTQETFVRAFRFLAQFDETKPLNPWLLRIARNLSYNRQRSLRRYWQATNRFLHNPFRPALEHSAVGSPDRKTDEQAQSDRLWQMVQRLKQQDQEVIYLYYFLDLSTAETAQALDVAQGTVKSRLHRALERLKHRIDRDEPALWEEWFS